MTEREAYIIFNMMDKIGPVLVRNLVERMGSVPAVLTAAEDELAGARGVSRELAQHICRQRGELDPVAEESAAMAAGYRILTAQDAEYPELLKQIHDPPLALYVRGSLRAGDRHAVAVVGTRKPTQYGRQVAEHLSAQVVQAGFTVVSGLATGVDTCAHEGALRAGGRTLAVLGGGANHFYPPENRALADRIAEAGAVMTEFPMGRQPDRTTFAIRNRIVSGLSLGTVVVEAGRKSGAMITANQAMEQGRIVFAVPGRIDNSNAQGPHDLIRLGAVLVRGAGDVLDELGSLVPRKIEQGLHAGTPVPVARLTDAERALVERLEDGERDVDTLIRETGLAAAEVGGLLIGLEMKRVVRILPGRIVERIRDLGETG